MSEPFIHSEEIRKAFAEYDRRVIFNNVKIGCVLGFILMPVGVVLDYAVYQDDVAYFLRLRFLCSALIGVFLAVVVTPFGQKHPRKLGVLLAMLPTFFISWMIYARDGSESPYYAGLNLVLLVVGFVLYWTFTESLVAVTLVLFMYIGACVLHGNISGVHFANNLYFLSLTGVIVVTGSYVHSRARFREFGLRYELDRNRKALEENNQKLLDLDRAKNRFFANISHELRTPLTLLLGPLEALLQRHRHSGDEELRTMLATMHGNSMRLLKLINDLLDLVRLESGRTEVKREAVDLDDFIRGLASAARQVASDKRIRLEVAVEPDLGIVVSDRDKLEKILLNLVFNALKFTLPGGRVDLRAGRREDRLILAVQDTGVGISAKHLPLVFDRFWQADTSSNRKFQGTGIGLALVKELAEVMNGKVSVESKEGQGTAFTVSLPYESAPEPSLGVAAAGPAHPEEEESGVISEQWLANLYRRAELFPAVAPAQESFRGAETPRDGSRTAVLVADDEPDMLRFLKTQLAADYHVYEACNGQEAVEKACQFLPDIILLDMMMPGKDGVEACRELREKPSTQSIPIILLTARADEETKLAALSAGASDFLAKPFSTTELRIRIRNLAESYHFQRRLSKQKESLEAVIHQLKETETQLVHSEKLASLGRLSAGIIHEINNPLNFAATGLYTLKNKVRHVAEDHRAEFEEVLTDVEEGVVRVKTIVSNLRSFTHPDIESVEDVDVGKVITSALHFLSAEWKGKIQIENEVPERQTVLANQNCLLHVLVNLLQNSFDALSRKKFRGGETPTVWIGGCVEGDKSVLMVRDNGEGIDPDHLGKVFDPFFTTKDVGEGMGLGLSICYRLVREYGGNIRVRSEPGKFCEFALEFPRRN